MSDNYTALPTPLNRSVGAPPGNKNRAIVKSYEDLQKLVDDYCTHVEQGFSDGCFVGCDMRVLVNYINPDQTIIELSPEKHEALVTQVAEAQKKRMIFWEKIGMAGMMGKINGFNAATWIFNMKNRFKWTDRQDLTSGGDKIEGPKVYIPAEVEEGEVEGGS